MPEQTTPEPSMEDILASIRRIISDEDAPQDKPAPAVDDEEEPLELTERADPPVREPEPEPVAELPPAAPVAPAPVAEGLVAGATASAAAAAFGQLSAASAPPADSRTLEDLTRELLKPMLQQWLDQHLPSIVQRAVDAEIDRISRQR